MLLRSQFSRQFPVKVPFHRILLHDFCNSTHSRLPPSVPAIFLRLSSAVEDHPAFEGSWPNLQLLGDLDLGQAAVHHGHSGIARR